MATIKTFMKGFLQGVTNLQVTSLFGKRHWNGKIKDHNGIDIGVPQGTILKAPLAGQVIRKTTQKNGAGLYVAIRYIADMGMYFDIYFMHLHTVDTAISVGVQVSEGQTIGTTGGAKGDPNAGTSTGPHLHLEIRRMGTVPVDPRYWFLARERLTAADSGKILNFGDDTWLSFPDSVLKTQTSYKYSAQEDITVADATEYHKEKKPPVPMEAKERLAPGVWQITKLLIDSSVVDKQVFDSGISTQMGSLLNFFRKVCQEPLVEMMGDTFGNQYYWIVRRPPFDKENMTRLIESAYTVLNTDDVLSANLTWSNQGIYSWYRYVPYGDLLGIPEAQLFMPAVFFPEYAAVWGSRPLALESNYYNWAESGRWNDDKTEQKNNGDRIIRNAVRDFKYLIESNAYNPFTRQGTITIQGDRRIKRGTMVRHTSGEVFHVDSVQNSYQVLGNAVQRTTTLQVSKGIYPAYIEGVELDGHLHSYFNIIDFGEDFDIEKITAANWKEYISKWKVNLESFGFFMTRQQVFWENVYINRAKNQ
jgi:hypothetical protein